MYALRNKKEPFGSFFTNALIARLFVFCLAFFHAFPVEKAV